MPFNFQAAVKKQYSVLPVPRDFIPSSNTPKPQILWVGCSDSLISETETLDVLSEELFVHRNLGNILSNHDLSSESAIEWAVGLLKVDHIIVCGHYDCGLIKEPADPHALHGWYQDVSKLHTLNDSYYSNLSPSERDHHFEEVYVLAEVEYLKKQPVVQAAIAERGLKVHAFVFERSEARCVRLVEGSVVQEKIRSGQGSVELMNEKVGFGGVGGGRGGVFEVEVR